MFVAFKSRDITIDTTYACTIDTLRTFPSFLFLVYPLVELTSVCKSSAGVLI